MKRVIYRDFFIDRTYTGYRISRQYDTSIHTHLRHLSSSYKLVDNVISKRIPKTRNLYYIQSHIRLTNDEEYKRKLQDYYYVKVNKGNKRHYYNTHKNRKQF